MYNDEAFATNVAFPMDFELTDDMAFTPGDPEFHHVVTDPRLSAELGELRRPRAEPTTAFVDGSARDRRDRRIEQRALDYSVRVLRVHTALPVTTDGEAA